MLKKKALKRIKPHYPPKFTKVTIKISAHDLKRLTELRLIREKERNKLPTLNETLNEVIKMGLKVLEEGYSDRAGHLTARIEELEAKHARAVLHGESEALRARELEQKLEALKARLKKYETKSLQ
jgi:hypothetical protein